eukprot:419522-Rhodomonas_salina.1
MVETQGDVPKVPSSAISYAVLLQRVLAATLLPRLAAYTSSRGAPTMAYAMAYARSRGACGTRGYAVLTDELKPLVLSLIHISEPTRPRLI